MDEMEKMVKYFLDERGWMHGWMDGRMDWRDLLQCIQETRFCQCIWTELSNAGSVLLSKGAWAEVGAMSKGPKWSSEWIRQLQPGQCCQQYHQSFDFMGVSSSPSCFFFKGLTHNHILTQPCAGPSTGLPIEIWYRQCKLCKLDTYYWGYGCKNTRCAPWIVDWLICFLGRVANLA